MTISFDTSVVILTIRITVTPYNNVTSHVNVAPGLDSPLALCQCELGVELLTARLFLLLA